MESSNAIETVKGGNVVFWDNVENAKRDKVLHEGSASVAYGMIRGLDLYDYSN